jgi:hypothetical protein
MDAGLIEYNKVETMDNFLSFKKWFEIRNIKMVETTKQPLVIKIPESE